MPGTHADQQVPAAHHQEGGSIVTDQVCRGMSADHRAEEEAGADDVPAAVPAPIALDIETDGLGPGCAVTCVCVWDGSRGKSWTPPLDTGSIVQALGAASQIWTFNGAQFDLPVLARCLCVDLHTHGAWQRKLVDPLHSARALLGTRACAKLSAVLELNGLESKSASGAEAVIMAREGRWRELEDYCMQDTRLTFELLNQEFIAWPGGVQWGNGCWSFR